MAKLELQTSRFGLIQVDEASIVNFPNGVIGFSEFKKFVVLDADSPFSWLQSVEDPTLAFLTVDALNCEDNYKVHRQDFSSQVNLEDKESHIVILVVAISEEASSATLNLRAPIVVNLDKKLAAQVVLDDESLSTKAILADCLS